MLATSRRARSPFTALGQWTHGAAGVVAVLVAVALLAPSSSAAVIPRAPLVRQPFQPLNPLPGFLGTPAPAPDQQESSPEAGANTPNPPELPETDPPQPESPPPQQTQPDAGNLQQPQSAPPPGPRAPGIVVPFLTVVPFDQLPPGGDGSAGGVGSEFDTSGLPPFGPSPDPGAGQFGPFSPLAPAPEPQPQPQPQPQPEPEPELEPEQDQGPRVQFQPLAQVLPRPNLEFGRR